MSYSEIDKQEIWDSILDELMTGKSLRKILMQKGMPPRITVFRWITDDEEKRNKYAQAREIYADDMFDEMLDIADSTDEDLINLDNGKQAINHHVIMRDRLRIDTRKWNLSRMFPKKYGEKLDLSSSDGTMTPKTTIVTTLSEADLKKKIDK